MCMYLSELLLVVEHYIEARKGVRIHDGRRRPKLTRLQRDRDALMSASRA